MKPKTAVKRKKRKKKSRPRPLIKITGDTLDAWGIGLAIASLVVDALILVAIFMTATWYQ